MKDLYFIAITTLVASFALVSYFIPKIRFIVLRRNLSDNPDKRSSHQNSTPTMAGVAFFLTLILVLKIIDVWDIDGISLSLAGSLTIIFSLGLKDDLILSTPKAKIGGEILAILFIIFCDGLEITSLDGFFGIQDIPVVASYAIIALMILTIINSYNLIDGIDGLASTIGIVVFGVFGFIFFMLDLHFYFFLCLSLTGILLAYLRYNLSKTNKVFMGDTGSLIIGFCIGFLSLKFLAIDASLITPFFIKPENKLFIIASLLFIPLSDTLRVIGVRLLNKKSPFSPDNNHIHHILINSGLSHVKSSLFLGILSLSLSVLFISLSRYLNSFEMFGILIISFLLFLGLFDKLKDNVTSKNKFNYLVNAIQTFSSGLIRAFMTISNKF
jgi:UDP-N-acetylmuramyl pentapeptide phosphotransferase/UDP-N-acetylglucosamine-1-phosphate transferase